MKVVVEIADEDARIVQKWSDIEMSVLVQKWITLLVENVKQIVLATEAGVDPTVEEVEKAGRESIARTLVMQKKIRALQKARRAGVRSTI